MTQVVKMVWLNAAIMAFGLVGCVSTSRTWNPGAPDAETVERITLSR
jgi:hypothetical protein